MIRLLLALWIATAFPWKGWWRLWWRVAIRPMVALYLEFPREKSDVDPVR